jgi:hypothetical protein
MGRLLKNPDLAYGSTAAKLPIVPSNSFGDSPSTGLIRFNQATNKIEFYYNNAWNQVAKIGTVPIYTDTFTTADGGSNDFTMTNAPKNYISGEENTVLVFIGGVQQIPVTHYTFSGGSASKHIYFTPSALGDAGQTILVIHNFNSTDAT